VAMAANQPDTSDTLADVTYLAMSDEDAVKILMKLAQDIYCSEQTSEGDPSEATGL